MKKSLSSKILSIVLSVILSTMMLFSAVGCGSSTDSIEAGAGSSADMSADSTTTVDVESGSETDSTANSSDTVTVLGTGSTQFMFTVVDADGNEKSFEIHTDSATVGDALAENELIEGEKSEYGLYVTTVDGTTLDYNEDGMYWAFYIDGEYASTGVDSTEVTAGAQYSFKAEKQ